MTGPCLEAQNPSDGKSNSGNEKHESVIEDTVQFM